MPALEKTPSNHHPHYLTTHMGDPCTLGSLDHQLTCNHKIITAAPEPCASNCHLSTSPYINPRSIDKPFTCMACLTERIKHEREEKVRSFRAELEAVAKVLKKGDGMEWIRRKIELVQFAWREVEIDRLVEGIAAGRFCHALYVDESCWEMSEVAVYQFQRSMGPISAGSKRYLDAGMSGIGQGEGTVARLMQNETVAKLVQEEAPTPFPARPRTLFPVRIRSRLPIISKRP